MKGTFSNSRCGKMGFTLVELVVVIAIIAILSGVGVAAYSGYVEHARKGVDRETVGEVIHALELADYADPGLFGENGGAMIVITEAGTRAAGGSDAEKLTAALNEAFGDISSASLKSGEWSGTVDYSVFSELPDSGAISEYLSTVKDGGGRIASFAGSMEELWGEVEALTGSLGSLAPGEESTLLQTAITNSLGAQKETIQTRWENGTKFTDIGAWAKAVVTARNYAFSLYAQKHPDFTSAEKAQLDTFMSGKQYGIDYVTTSESGLTGDNWTAIMDDYKSSGQAKADALAFLGVMEAGQTLGGSDGMNDKEYIENIRKYVGMVDNILTNSIDLTSIKELANSVAGEKALIVINATKKNGVMSFDVTPKDANPRDGEGENAEVSYDTAMKVVCELGATNKVTPEKTEIRIKSDGKCIISVLTTDKDPATRANVNQVDGEGCAEVVWDSTSAIITVTGIAVGTASFTVSYGVGCEPATITVIVD